MSVGRNSSPETTARGRAGGRGPRLAIDAGPGAEGEGTAGAGRGVPGRGHRERGDRIPVRHAGHGRSVVRVHRVSLRRPRQGRPDAKTGKLYWFEDLRSSVWGQPLWVDGKIFISTDMGDVFVYAHGNVKKQLARISADHAIRAGMVFANGALYIPTETDLHVIRNLNEVACAPITSVIGIRSARCFGLRWRR